MKNRKRKTTRVVITVIINVVITKKDDVIIAADPIVFSWHRSLVLNAYWKHVPQYK